jgi:hypothetical protein
MQYQVAFGIARYFNPAADKSELLRNPHGLAVAVHKDATDGFSHEKTLCTHLCVCMIKIRGCLSRNLGRIQIGAPPIIGLSISAKPLMRKLLDARRLFLTGSLNERYSC